MFNIIELMTISLSVISSFSTGSISNIYSSALPYLLFKNENTFSTNSTNNITINNEYINNIMSMLYGFKSFSALISAPIYGSISKSLISVNLIFIGLIIQLISIIIYFIAFNNIYLHILCRTLDGIAVININCSTYHIIWEIFHKKKLHSLFISLVSSTYYIGLISSPYVAAKITETLHFNYISLYLLILIVITKMLWLIFYLYNKKYKYIKKIEEDKIKIRFLQFFKVVFNPFIFILLFGIFIHQFIFGLLQINLTVWMYEKFGIEEVEVGKIWMSTTFTIFIVTLLCMIVFQFFHPYRYLGVAISCLLLGIGCIALPFYPIYWNVGFSLAIYFLSSIVICYVNYPMTMEIITKLYGCSYTRISSGLPTFSAALAALVAGFTGGPITNLIGFRPLYLISGILMIIFSGFNYFLKTFS